jgi:hypothetical protein
MQNPKELLQQQNNNHCNIQRGLLQQGRGGTRELAKNHRLLQHQLKSNATPEETRYNMTPHPLDPEGGGGGGAGGGERGGRRA